MNKTIVFLLGTVSLINTAWASGDHGKPATGGSHAVQAPQTTPATSAATATTEGQVTKVDADNKKLTLRHGEIKNLEMPAMTMVFQVKDPAMLEKVKTGDKVRFTADKVNGAFTVTSIEVAK
jgi:Cu(I)/Ag(I) efflux system protein CusF